MRDRLLDAQEPIPYSHLTIKQMKKGKIKFYLPNKGYGFIIPDEGGKDIFFHFTSCNYEDIREEDAVTYEEQESQKGILAVNVELDPEG